MVFTILACWRNGLGFAGGLDELVPYFSLQFLYWFAWSRSGMWVSSYLPSHWFTQHHEDYKHPELALVHSLMCKYAQQFISEV